MKTKKEKSEELILLEKLFPTKDHNNRLLKQFDSFDMVAFALQIQLQEILKQKLKDENK